MPIDSTGMETKIIEAAVNCIEKYGLQGATIRRIADSAGVNLAAINYYFRSKEILMEKVTQVTLANAFDWKEFSTLQADSIQEKFAAIFENLVQGACLYPGMTRYYFYEMIEGKSPSLSRQKFDAFMLELVKFARANGIQKEEGELRLAFAQATSAVMMAALLPNLFLGSFDMDIRNAAVRKRFIMDLVNKLF